MKKDYYTVTDIRIGPIGPVENGIWADGEEGIETQAKVKPTLKAEILLEGRSMRKVSGRREVVLGSI